MFGRLFLLFLLIPLVDLTLLVTVGQQIGLWPTVGIVVATAAVGSWLAKREGFAAWQRVRTKLSTGTLPGAELVDGIVILISGVLLLTPGFLTDLAGIVGLIPPVRRAARRKLMASIERSVMEGRIRVVHGVPGQRFSEPAPFDPYGLPPEPTVEDAEIVDDGMDPRRVDGGHA